MMPRRVVSAVVSRYVMSERAGIAAPLRRDPILPGSPPGSLAVVIVLGEVRLQRGHHERTHRQTPRLRESLGALPQFDVLIPDINGDLLTHTESIGYVRTCTGPMGRRTVHNTQAARPRGTSSQPGLGTHSTEE